MPYLAIFRVLDELELGTSDVFYDFGCGKGRVVCCASLYGISESVGVEVDTRLVHYAEKNAAVMRKHHSPIRIVASLAEAADVGKCTAAYFFCPFGPATLEKVLENIHNSLILNPRYFRLAYMTKNPGVTALLDSCSWLRLTGQIAPAPDIGLVHAVSIYALPSPLV
jgi:hypothetical protein